MEDIKYKQELQLQFEAFISKSTIFGQDFIGITSIAVVCLITFVLALRNADLSKILFVALSIRILAMLYGHYISPLPDSTADMKTFEYVAWTHSIWDKNLLEHNSFSSVIDYFEGPSAKFITHFLAIPYYLIGRSMLMAQSISLLLGIGCVFLGWKVAKILWDNHTAKKVGWTIALFPSLILYSVLVMREVYICFFLLVALYGVAEWTKTDSLKSFFLALSGFTGAVFFHGSMIVGAIIFVLFVGIITLKKMFISVIKYRVNYKLFIFLCLFLVCSNLYLSNKISVPYLGNFESSTDLTRVMHKTTINTRGDAAWPEWSIIHSPAEVIYKLPIRAIYFLFAPFPWDIKKNIHIIGMLDAFLYMYLVFLILNNRKAIWKDPASRIIFIILLSYIFVFAFGVGNFGTGIRHRSKFVILFILLAAPLIKRFVFFKKLDKV